MKKFINVVLIIITVSMILGTIGISGIFVFLKDRSRIEIDEMLMNIPRENSNTILYCYSNGDYSKPEILNANISNSSTKYSYTPLSKIPQDMINAFVSIEDKNYFSHNGVDFLRSIKAILNYTVKKSQSFGASTITQQVIKNLTGESERTPTRKINEIFYALNLEKKHTKQEILETYLNIINLSNGCMGVGAASEYYFSKKPHELSLEEIATIAAITNNPSLYNPQRHPENVISRRNLVLRCMYEQEYISEKEYTHAINSQLILNVTGKPSENIDWFEETVISDLLSDLMNIGYSRSHAYNKIFNGGLRVYTTVNKDIQSIIERYYENLDMSTDNMPSPQSAMIIMNPYNGDILGIAGSVGRKTGSLIQNYATDVKRPPGSAIKPLSVYAPLIEQGDINWSTIVEDSPTSVIDGREWPQNANRMYSGNVDISDAIANSINTVAVKMLYKLGAQNSLSFLKDQLRINCLIPPSKNNVGDQNAVSLALGQTLHGVTLRELTSAYSIFTEGNMSTARSYYKVTDTQGNIIIDKRKNQEQVISLDSASLMTKLLQEVITDGTAAGKLTLNEHISVAGKTGTTQNNCDRLFVAYTPSLLAGVWCGYDYPKPMDYGLKNPSITIWNDVMEQIYKLSDAESMPKEFKHSDRLQRLAYNKDTGELIFESEEVENISYGWFITKE